MNQPICVNDTKLRHKIIIRIAIYLKPHKYTYINNYSTNINEIVTISIYMIIIL